MCMRHSIAQDWQAVAQAMLNTMRKSRPSSNPHQRHAALCAHAVQPPHTTLTGLQSRIVRQELQSQYLIRPSHPQVATFDVSSGCHSTPIVTV